MLHAACVGEEAGARNLVFFRVKWLRSAMKGTSTCAAVAAAVASVANVFLFCVLQRVVVPVCVVLCVALNLRLRIALEWLHDCCHLVLPHAQIRAGLRRDAAKRIVYNGCLNVVWGLCWRGSRSMKPCVFQCKVAAVGDERYILCAAVAAAVVESAVADRIGMAA